MLKKGYGWENSALGTTLAYREWEPFFKSKKVKAGNGKLRGEIIQRWKFDEHAYARRQLTWFKKQKNIKWYDISQTSWRAEVEKEFKKCYHEKDGQQG